MILKFSKELYPRIALLKAAYAFTDRAYLHLDADADYYMVEINAKPGCEQINENDFVELMLAHSLRHEIYKQTATVRELILARAVGSTVIQKIPLPRQLDSEDQWSADSILKDWYEAYQEPPPDR